MPDQYLTYQHNVQRYFREHREKYSGILIPLSIATAFPSGTYGFVRALCARDRKKCYAIDPRTALFQKDWNRANVRDPHKKMAAVMGGPFVEIGLSGAMSPENFSKDAVLSGVVERCLSFQKDFRASPEDERKLEKYKKMLKLDSLRPLGEPMFLIPPYFQFSAINDGWYKVSKRCVEKSRDFCGQLPLQPVVHFAHWEGLTWTKHLEWQKDQKIKAFWFYPNNFKEHTAKKEELEAYRDAVSEANHLDLEPCALFGGYFAILMSYFGLRSFGNGIGYGEWRDSGYHKGGTAAIRIYILKLHQFLDAPAAQSLIENNPEYFGTGSEIIEDCIATDRPLSNLSLAEGLDHFMECRYAEMQFVEDHSVSEAAKELRQTIRKLKSMPVEREKYGKSLHRWVAVLESTDEEVEDDDDE